MVSSIHNIPSASKLSEIKDIDARLDMHSHKLNADQNKHKSQGNTEDEDQYCERSVKALILFLEDFLETQMDGKLHSNSHTPFSDWINTPPNQQNNQNDATRQKKAIEAYIHAAQTSQTPQDMTIPTKNMENERAEFKRIYLLIRDLRQLLGQNIEHLQVENSKPLIGGIIEAVKLVKLGP